MSFRGGVVLVALVFFIGFRRWMPLTAIVHSLIVCCIGAIPIGAAIFGALYMITVGLCRILVGLGVDFAMVLYALYAAEREAGHGSRLPGRRCLQVRDEIRARWRLLGRVEDHDGAARSSRHVRRGGNPVTGSAPRRIRAIDLHCSPRKFKATTKGCLATNVRLHGTRPWHPDCDLEAGTVRV